VSADTVVRFAAAPRALAWALAASAISTAGASAQLGEPRVGAGVRFESYSFSDAESVNLESVSLLTIPVSARATIGRRFELGVTGAFASGAASRQSGHESKLSGLIDTQVRLTARLAEDRFRLEAVALLPTGTGKLEADELDVAGLIAADVLPFAISHWGTGGGVGVNAAAAVPVSPATTLGFSAGYVLAREYEPLAAGDFNYRPGNQLHARAALDHVIGRSGKIAVALSYQRFSEDQGNGTNLYQAGDRLQGVGSLAFPAGARASGIVYLGILRRLEGKYTSALLPVVPTEDLAYAGGSMRQPLAGLVLLPSVELRLVGNDDGIDQGYTVSAGTGAEVPLGTVELVPSVRLRFGRLTVRENQESGITGLELGLTLRNGR
jgi:hypothetical protein